MLVIILLIVYSAFIFSLRYLVGVITFWGKEYLKQGYCILQSDRSSYYLLDSAIIFSLSVIGLYSYRFHPSLVQMAAMRGVKWTFFLVLLFLLSLPFRKRTTFYNERGLLMVKPFKGVQPISWHEIERIEKMRFQSKYYILFDQDGKRLVSFPLNKKTKQFIDLARQNGVACADLSEITMKALEKNLRKLSMTGRLCYLFMCMEVYLVTLFPERDWSPVAKRCWQWTKNYWNESCEIYSAVVPEFLFEFEGYEKTNEINFKGTLPEKDYRELMALFTGLTTGDEEDEINQLLMLPIDFCNACEGASLSWASSESMDVFRDVQNLLSKHGIPLPDMSKIKHMPAGDGWGGFVDSDYLSIIIKKDIKN